jgi:hypothetical protein
LGVEIKLTDRDLPVSPAFVDFLYRQIEIKDFDATWYDQLSEELVPARFDERVKAAEGVANQVLQHPVGQKAIYRSYELLTAFLTGHPEKLRSLHDRFRFICVVGCPRHGGSYLVKQLFLALGSDPKRVPNVLAHDGFPNAAPFRFQGGHNSLTTMIQQMAEYLAMVEVFFADSRKGDDLVVVPKKATKAAYHGAFFGAALGPNTEYVVTLRHPLPACISTYEKSTGLPADGKFKVRGNIEEWAQRDNEFTGADPAELLEKDYFDVYLRYWEQYHLNLALTGLSGRKPWNVVAYGRDRTMGLAREYFRRFGGVGEPEDFKVFDLRNRHKEWCRRSEEAILRIADAWRSMGLVFPVADVMECW